MWLKVWLICHIYFTFVLNQSIERENKFKSKIIYPTIERQNRLDNSQSIRGNKNEILDWLLIRSYRDRSRTLQPYGTSINSNHDHILKKNNYLNLVKSEKKINQNQSANPFTISELFLDNGKILSKSGKNLFQIFFGQFVINEVVDTLKSNCPVNYLNVEIPENHEFNSIYKRSNFAFKKLSQSNKLQSKIKNFASQWIDGETIYGRSKVETDSLRSFDKGKLKINAKTDLPVKNNRKNAFKIYPSTINGHTKFEPLSNYFAIGDNNGHENPFILAINIVWAKWHNLIAEKLYSINPYWPDWRLFEEARRWVIASQQQIIINEWLPLFLGKKLSKYKNFTGNGDATISALFSGSAMRIAHTMIPISVQVWKNSCKAASAVEYVDHKSNTIRLCNSYYRSNAINSTNDLTEIIVGLTLQSATESGLQMNHDLRTRSYGSLDNSRTDLVALNILRGRDLDLPNYILARKFFRLSFPANFNEAFATVWNYSANIENLQENLQNVYQKIEDVDLWIGGLLETQKEDNEIGELFRAIIGDEFAKIRDTDYYWFENTENGIFDLEEIERIKTLSIRDILIATLELEENLLLRKPFSLPNNQDNPIPDCNSQNFIAFSCSSRQFADRLCYSLQTDNENNLPNCPSLQGFDYFASSELWFITILIGLIFYIMIAYLLRSVLIYNRRMRLNLQNKKILSRKLTIQIDDNHSIAYEWLGLKHELRTVVIIFENGDKTLSVHQFASEMKLLRRIDLKKMYKLNIESSTNTSKAILSIKFRNEQDLILKFDTSQEKNHFLRKLELFLSIIGIGKERKDVDCKKILKNAYTKEKRQKQLESFFRAVFANAFDMKFIRPQIDLNVAKDILKTELTQCEFAESLGMRSDSLFVRQMFTLVDKDNNGFISFREFLDMMVIFAKGSADQKAKLMFDMYDIHGTGSLSKEEFSTMIRSMLELANQTIDQSEMDSLIKSMFESAGIVAKNYLTLTDFLKFLGDYKDEFGYVELNFDVSDLGTNLRAQPKRQSMMVKAQDTVYRAYSLNMDQKVTLRRRDCKSVDSVVHIETKQRQSRAGLFDGVERFFDEKKWHFFWILIYFILTFYIFFNKAIFYSYQSKDKCLHQITGYGIAITRGSASVMMFTFSLLFLTMSRNIITFLRETFIHFYVPFDASIGFHKIVAINGLVFTVIHCVGHLINFYNIQTQRPEDLVCYFSSYYYNKTSELIEFKDWMFLSITGITSILLIIILTLIYLFAAKKSRKYIFNWFWFTHSMYPIVYLLIYLHGLGKLIQSPEFHKYIALPLAVFKLDQLMSVKRKKREITIIKTAHFPSQVTMLELSKPIDFDFISGQWLRIACTKLNPKEFHPFTIASAPHEQTIKLFIRAVGPFTSNIRKIYSPDLIDCPKVYIDGPFGETHQDWFRYPVSILVGGGIGVTPFASILKDVAYRSANNCQISCKKVYFLWVTRTQKHFEWLVDILRDLEEQDLDNLVEVHIFITQFYEKFDLRTMMLYVCERHFQRISRRSLFTGLKAKTQFGRPNFEQFFLTLQRFYTKIDRIGVFTCGPPAMTRSVTQACEQVNRRKGALFVGHSENF